MAYLELRDIKKSYYLGSQEFPVLKGINLSFEQGEFVSILGESGGGKTTLMNIIGGLTAATPAMSFLTATHCATTQQAVGRISPPDNRLYLPKFQPNQPSNRFAKRDGVSGNDDVKS